MQLFLGISKSAEFRAKNEREIRLRLLQGGMSHVHDEVPAAPVIVLLSSVFLASATCHTTTPSFLFLDHLKQVDRLETPAVVLGLSL